MNNGTAVSPSRPPQHQSSSAQLQRQALLQQQQQKQQQQNRPRPNIQNYHFATSSADILRKYAKYPASITLHIYETHYRFNNSSDSNIIPKNSPMIKDFLHHVMKEQIPVEMSELLKDFSIKSYDGCLILQVFDHRNMVSTAAGVTKPGSSVETKEVKKELIANGSTDNGSSSASASGAAAGSTVTASASSATATASLGSGPATASGGSSAAVATSTIPKPKTYRTLLRPTQLSLYYDLLYHTDSALTKFTDSLSLQMESEILTLTNRKLDLAVPLNPYLCDEFLRPEPEYPKKVWDEAIQDYKLVHSHREAADIRARKIHQDEMVLHKTSEYEEIMLLLSNKYKRTDESQGKKLIIVGPSASAAAAATTNNTTPANPAKQTSKEGTSGPDSKVRKGEEPVANIPAAPAVTPAQSTTRSTGQFMRLRLIEEIRKKREAERASQEAKLQAQTQAVQSDGNPALNSVNQIPHDKRKLADMEIQRQQQLQQSSQQQSQQSPPSQQGQLQQKKLKKESVKPQIPQQVEQQFGNNNGNKNGTNGGGIATPQQNDLPVAPQPIRNGTVISAQQQQLQQQVQQQQQAQQQQLQQQRQQQQQQQRMIQQNTSAPGSSQSSQQSSSQTTATASSGSGSHPTLLQQQQQQIFQNSLTPEEQQVFRQLQQRMNTFAVMGNTGVAPNRHQLTAQQQQQAQQQAKAIQQQLMQKFPLYFQRLRQFHLIQQQRQQKQKQIQEKQMQAAAQSNSNSHFNQQQHPNISGKVVPGSAQSQADKKKRNYKKKN